MAVLFIQISKGNSSRLPATSRCEVISRVFLEEFNAKIKERGDCHTLLKMYFTKTSFNSSEKERFIKSFLDMKISAEEVEFILNVIPPNKLKENEELIKSYILYSRVRQKMSRKKIYLRTKELFDSPQKQSRTVRKFYHYLKLKKKYENKLIRKFDSNVALGDKDMFLKKVEKQTKAYEELLYSCRWNSKSMLKRNKRLIYTLTGSGIASATITYSYVNWDKEKDPRKNPKWLGDLIYTQFVSMLWGLINNYAIYSNFNFHPWRQKLPISYLTIGIEDILSSQGYEKLFNGGLNKIDFQAIVKNSSDKILSLIKTKDNKSVLWHYQHGNVVDFKKEIDLEITRANLLNFEAMKTSDDYQLINTGNIGWDRYIFHRGFDLVIAPASVIITSKIEKAICMNQHRIDNLDILTAASFMTYRLITDAIYYFSRRKVINQ
jgi:hypothetical protein